MPEVIEQTQQPTTPEQTQGNPSGGAGEQNSTPQIDPKEFETYKEKAANWDRYNSQFEGGVEGLESFARRADAFIKDPAIAPLLNKWMEGKPLTVAENKKLNDSGAKEQVRKEAEPKEFFDPRVDQLLQQQQDMVAEMKHKQERSQLQSELPWLSNEKYAEFNKKFIDAVTPLAKNVQREDPRLSFDEAFQIAASRNYGNVSLKTLLIELMPEDWTNHVAGKMPRATPLPPGMRDGMKVGNAPSRIEQAKKAYEAAEADGDPKAMAKARLDLAHDLNVDADEAMKYIRS